MSLIVTSSPLKCTKQKDREMTDHQQKSSAMYVLLLSYIVLEQSQAIKWDKGTSQKILATYIICTKPYPMALDLVTYYESR